MKKMTRNFLTFLLLFNSLSYIAQSESETILKDPQGYFSLPLGPGWVSEQIKDPHHFGKYAYVQNQQEVAKLAAGSEKLKVTMTPLQYAEAFEKNLMGMPQYHRLQMSPVDLAGRETIYLQFSGVNPQTNNKLIFEVYIFIVEMTSYMIVFSANTDQYNTLKPVFDQVIQSIQYSPRVKKQTESGITFNDPQRRMSLQLEPKWTPLPLQQKGVLGRYYYGQSTLDQLVIRSEVLPKASSPLEYAQSIEQKELLGKLPQYQKHQATTINLGGQEAAYYQFSFEADTPEGKYQIMSDMYCLILQNTAYIIAFSSTESKYSNLKPIFDRVLQSIQYKTAPIRSPATAAQAANKTTSSTPSKDVKGETLQKPSAGEQGQGTLHIELPNWAKGAPYYYKILKMSDGTEVTKIDKKLEDIPLPTETYKIIWRQTEHYNDEVLLADNIEIKSGQVTPLNLNTGIKIIPANWVQPKPYYWYLKNPVKDDQKTFRQTLDPQLVPPGKYELWYRQHEHRNRGETRLATSVEIKPGELTQLNLNTGIKLVPKDSKATPPYQWVVTDLETNQPVLEVRQTWDPQPIAPGRYKLSVQQTEHGHQLTEVASDFKIQAGNLLEIKI